MENMQIVPPSLTLPQQFKLLEMAYETRDEEIKKLALDLLRLALYPPHFVGTMTSTIPIIPGFVAKKT